MTTQLSLPFDEDQPRCVQEPPANLPEVDPARLPGKTSTPRTRALGVVYEPMWQRWRASGDVEGIGWLEAWGRTLIEAMEAWQAKAAKRVAEEERKGD
jgi:hypothetical protein